MKHYPYIVYRYQHGFYGNASINFVGDERLLSKGKRVTIFWKGDVFDDTGKITPRCKEILRAFGIKQKEESRFRLCIVYGQSDCDYFESGGVVNQSDQPPSSTINLGDGEYDSEFRIDSCRLDLKLTKIDESDSIGAKQVEGKKCLFGAEKLLAILVIITASIYSGCSKAGAASKGGYSGLPVSKTDCFPTSRPHKRTNEPVTRTKNSHPTALCRDGSLSRSASRSGTCSHHGGVEKWLVRSLK